MRRLLFALLLIGIALPPVQAASREVLPNGLRVLVLPNSSTEVVAASLLIAIPVSADPPEQAGLRYLTHRLLLRGSKTLSGDDMGRRLAAVGGRVGENCTLDYVEISVQAPSEGFEVALDLLSKAVMEPAFAAEDFEREKSRARVAMRAARDDPFSAAYQALREELYGADGYGRWTLGDSDNLAEIGREDVLQFYRENYRPERAVLAIAGGVDSAAARSAARLRFGDWHGVGEAAPVAEREEAAPLTSSQMVARARDTQRLHLLFGFPAPAGRFLALLRPPSD